VNLQLQFIAKSLAKLLLKLKHIINIKFISKAWDL